MKEMPNTAKANKQLVIIDTAADLICAHGVNGMTMSQLIKGSGVSAGAIYHHFGSKNSIVTEVARQAISWPLQALSEFRDEARSPMQLIEFSIRAVQAAPELGDLLLQLGAGAATDDELGRLLQAEFKPLRDALEDTMISWATQNGIPEAMMEGRSQLYVGLVLGFITQRRLISNFDEDEYLRYAQLSLEVTRQTDATV